MERWLQGGFCCSWSCFCAFTGCSFGLWGCFWGFGCRSCCGRCSWAPPGLLSPMKWVGNTRFSLLGGSRSGRISETRRGRAGGPGVRGPTGRPGRSCGFGLFPSLRLRGFFPSWDPGAVCSVFSVRFSAGGKKEEKKGKPASVVILKEKGLPPLCSLSFFPQILEKSII